MKWMICRWSKFRVDYSPGRADEGSSEELEFEEAAKYRDRIKHLRELLGH